MAETRTYKRSTVMALVYLVIGVIITVNQGYWHPDRWGGHFLSSLLTGVVASVLWPLALFYTFILTRS
jgi:hypothetical protein